MIVVRIHGGLGNQMFQYAIGRHIAFATGQSLRLEIGHRNPNPLGRFDLDRYRIAATVASPTEAALLWRPLARLVGFLGLPSKADPFHGIYIQRTPHFYPAVLRIRRSAYLVGHWLSERYFSQSAALIRDDLTLKEPPRGKNAQLLDQIQSVESVAVHVRRGDYVTNPEISADYNVCNEAYYRRALRTLLPVMRSPTFYVFSDDPTWCRENLSFVSPAVFVDINGPEGRHEDLRLMTACRHFIIANSTFGWWGAWLSRFAGKRIVAPKAWTNCFSDDIYGNNPESAIPV